MQSVLGSMIDPSWICYLFWRNTIWVKGAKWGFSFVFKGKLLYVM